MDVKKPVLELKSVTKKFGDFQAVSEANLNVYPGEFLTLLGPSGSGKTTILQMIAGFVALSGGAIALSGQDISNIPPNKRNMGIVFQDYALFPHLNVYHNIAYPLKIRKIKKEKMKFMVDKAMNLVQLNEFSHRKPNELSGGQQQRVALARALVFNPSLILMDEPFGALDKKLREHMQMEMKEIQRESGITIIFVTHDQEEALVMSDRICVLNESKIVQVGSPRELYRNPVNSFTADFIGKNNFIEGYIEKITPSLEIVLETNESILFKNASTVNKFYENQKIKLSVRPEDLMINEHINNSLDDYHNWVGNISEISYLGDTLKYSVSIKDSSKNTELEVLTNPDQVFKKNQEVYIGCALDNFRVFPL